MPVSPSRRRFASIALLSVVVTASTTAMTFGQPRIDVNGVAAPATVPASAGSVASLSVSDGPANTTDWVGLYPVGAADNAYLTWYYLTGTTTAPPSGLADATVTVLLPTSPGEYEFRLFAANGYTKLATSPAVHVLASAATVRVNGVLAPAAVSVSPATALIVVIDGAPANPTDWIGLYPVGASDTAYVEWQYLNGSTTAPTTGVNSATLGFFAPAGSGTYELRLFAGGGFSRLAVSATIAVSSPQAAVLVNGTAPPTSVTVASGSLAVLTVTGAPGNATDWLGLYPVGAPDTGYVDWRYLNGLTTPPAVALTDAAVPWLMPATPATYEFRLFAHNAYQRVATSSPVTVPVSAALVAVNGVVSPQATTAGAGTVLTVTIADGPGNPADWVGLFVAGAPDASPLTWQYLNGSTTPPSLGMPNASLRMLAPATAGAVDVRFLTANTYNRLAASGVVTITASPARIAVNGSASPASVNATPGSSLTVEVSGSPGNRADWMGLYRLADPDTAPLTWAYLSGSTTLPDGPLTSATWSLTAPSEAGTYQVRLFVDNGYARLATSGAIVVGAPAVSVTLTSPFPGTVYPAGASITFSATASATGATVVRVEFELDGVVVGSSSEPPYGTTWNASPVGEHVILAVATDNLGGRTASSPISVGVAATGPGVLGPPLVSPPGGRFGVPPLVAMVAAAGATIRYTTDRSEPDETSPLYTGPITIDQDSVVLAKAFQSGWTPSPWTWVEFTIDRTPPEVLVFPIPAPNADGWNNSAVTLSFRCHDPSGVRSCSAPVTVDTDGVTIVEGTGTDVFGNQATVSRTVRLDRTAPSLVLSGDTSRQTADAVVTLAGTVTDAASGVARVTCNGASATLDASGAFICNVPLQPGLNAVVVHALDLAGNGRSVGLRVTRLVPVDTIQVSPVRATIGLGESRELSPVDPAGQPLANVEWTVDDSAVLSLTTMSGRVSVVGLSAGIGTVTATFGALTASATITVVTGTLPVGTVRWTSAPGAPGAVVGSAPLFATRVEASVPDLHVVESTPGGSQLLHGVFADGTPGPVWTVSPDSSSFVTLSLADRTGGAILDVWSWGGSGSQRAFVRIPGTANGLPWRYEAASTDPTRVGQSPEGTVFLLEPTDGGSSGQVVGLDGETGEVKFRYTPPGTRYCASYHVDCWTSYHSIRETGPALSNGVVGYDGALYALVLTSRRVTDAANWMGGCWLSPLAAEEKRATLSVARVTADGAASVYELQTVEGTNWLNGWTLVPDPRGGVHAEWSAPDGETLHARVGPGLSSALQSGPLGFDRIGDGVGFDGAGTAYDLDTGAVKFTPGDGVWMVTALAGGGVAVTNGETLTTLDENGIPLGSEPMPSAAFGGGELWASWASSALSGFLLSAADVGDAGVDGVASLNGPYVVDHTLAFPDANGAPQPMGGYYATAKKAATAAVRAVMIESQAARREYGASICELRDEQRPLRFFAPRPQRGLPYDPDVSNRVVPTPCPATPPNTKRSDYHTHWGVDDGVPYPIGDDYRGVVGQVRFLGSWCGSMMKYWATDDVGHGMWDYLFENEVTRTGLVTIPLLFPPPPNVNCTNLGR